MDSKKKTRLILLILIITPFLALAPIFLNPDNFFQRNNDFLSYTVPLFDLFKNNIIRNKQIPLWQNTYLSGYPLLGDPQTILLYPLNYLSLFIDFQLFFILYYLFHLILAGFSVYYLCRLIFKFSEIPAILSGLIYSLSPKLIAHIEAGHSNLLASYAYIPLVLLLYFLLIKRPTFIKVIIFGFSVAMVYILYLTTFYYLLLILLGLTIYLLFNRNKEYILKRIFYLSVGCLFFLGFILPGLLASIELWPQVIRNLLTYEDIAGSVLAWRQIVNYLFNPQTIINTHTEMVLYIGFFPGLLFITSFIRTSRKNKILILLILTFCLLYAIGPKTFFYNFLFNKFPGVNLFRVPSRMWFIVSLMISIVAGAGFDLIYKANKILAMFLFILCMGEFIFLANQRLEMTSDIPTGNISNEFRQLISNEKGYFRIHCIKQCIPLDIIFDNYLSLTSGYNPVQLKNYFWFYQKASGFQFASYAPSLPPYQTFADILQPNAMLLGNLGVRFVISPYTLEDKNFHFIKKIDDLYLYKNYLEKPRVYIKNAERETLLSIKKDIPGYVATDLPNQEYGEIVLNEVYTTGWRVYIDGRKTRSYQINDIVIGSNIPRNTKTVTFSYEPLGTPYSWYILIMVYIFSILVIIKKGIIK